MQAPFMPNVYDLEFRLGYELDQQQRAQAESCIEAGKLAVHAYTRGIGVDLEEDTIDQALSVVVLSFAVRMFLNPASDEYFSAGNLTIKQAPPEFLLHERLIMDNFRRKSA